ncbi:MAG: CHAT domain-containing protein [Cyanobacteria bacterium J06638_20]
MTQEFHISVTPVRSDEYLVRTEHVAPGVPLAEEQVKWELDEWLTYARQLMNNPLLELLQGNGTRVGGFEFYPRPLGNGGGNAQTPTLLELGQTLYNSLFSGTLRDSWMTARGIAQHKGEMLRLRLGLKGEHLPRLPWEVMNAGDRDGLGTMRNPIATGTDVVFSRYQPGITMMGGYLSILAVKQPIRVLLAIAAPTDQERLELKREAEHLQEELQQTKVLGSDVAPGVQVEFEVTVLEQPGRAELTQALEQGQYHIFHYAGHSNLGVAGGNLYLVNPQSGLTEALSGDDLAGLLVNNSIRLVVFNSCRGTHSSLSGYGPDAEGNLAEALVSRGIPAVLAMAEKIPDNVALTLTRLFYRNLKQGYPLDLSLSRARQGLISSFGSHQFYWALPVLYLHPEWDGYLAKGDRTRINPADRLVLTPQVSNPPSQRTGEVPDPVRPGAAVTNAGADAAVNAAAAADVAASADAEWDMISRAVLTDEELSPHEPALSRPPIPPDPDELGYAADAPSIAEIIEELSPREAVEPNRSAPDNSGETSPNESMANAAVEPTETQEADAVLSSPSTSGGDANPEDEMVTIYPTLEPQDDVPNIGVAERGESETATLIPKRNRTAYIVLPLVGAAAMAIAVAVMPNGLLRNNDPSPSDMLPQVPASPDGESSPLSPPDGEALTEEAQLRARAIQGFDQGDLDAGTDALALLLDRNALEDFRAVYANLTPEQVSDPEVLYLTGRHAWQAMRQGNLEYSVDDVRRYWSTAVEKKADVAAYHNALGFAYYREGKFSEAVRAWCRAIALINDPNVNVAGANPATIQCPVPDGFSDSNLITPYAGIALVYQRIATEPAIASVENPLAQAKQLNTSIIQDNPDARTIQDLPNGWLWTEDMIEEWNTLNTRPVEN